MKDFLWMDEWINEWMDKMSVPQILWMYTHTTPLIDKTTVSEFQNDTKKFV
jgi:hypothetical protein